MSLSALILLAAGLTGAAPTPTGGYVAFPSRWDDSIDNAALPAVRKQREFDDVWRRQVANLAAMKFNTLIVQYVLYDTTLYFEGEVVIGGAPLTPAPGKVAPRSLSAVMKAAEANRMAVWVGLRQRSVWDMGPWSDLVTSPDSLVDETLATAEALKASGVLDSKQFAGWYISPEVDNYLPGGTTLFALADAGNRALRRLTTGLKAVADKPVAVSGFFRAAPGNMGGPDFLNYLFLTLRGSGVDVFLYQDGVGVADTPLSPEPRLTRDEIQALADVHKHIIVTCRNAGVTPWADVELFASGVSAADVRSGPPARALGQLQAAALYPKRVVYDVNTDLTPFGGKPGSSTLFLSFYRWLSGRPYRP